MPAIREEVDEAVARGRRAPAPAPARSRFHGNGRVRGGGAGRRSSSATPDESGRRRPRHATGSPGSLRPRAARPRPGGRPSPSCPEGAAIRDRRVYARGAPTQPVRRGRPRDGRRDGRARDRERPARGGLLAMRSARRSRRLRAPGPRGARCRLDGRPDSTTSQRAAAGPRTGSRPPAGARAVVRARCNRGLADARRGGALLLVRALHALRHVPRLLPRGHRRAATATTATRSTTPTARAAASASQECPRGAMEMVPVMSRRAPQRQPRRGDGRHPRRARQPRRRAASAAASTRSRRRPSASSCLCKQDDREGRRWSASRASTARWRCAWASRSPARARSRPRRRTASRTWPRTCSPPAFYRLPIVMMAVNRTLGPPWNIWVDHGDTLMLRDAGWIQIYCEDNQEVLRLDPLRVPPGRGPARPAAGDGLPGRVRALAHDDADRASRRRRRSTRFLPPLDLPHRVARPARGGRRRSTSRTRPRCTAGSTPRRWRACPTVYARGARTSSSARFGRRPADPVVPYRMEDAELVARLDGHDREHRARARWTRRARAAFARARSACASSARSPRRELRARWRAAGADRRDRPRHLASGSAASCGREVRGAAPPGRDRAELRGRPRRRRHPPRARRRVLLDDLRARADAARAGLRGGRAHERADSSRARLTPRARARADPAARQHQLRRLRHVDRAPAC